MTNAVELEDLDRARAAFFRVGVVLPLAVTATACVLMLLWLPELPTPAATHWSGSGPDGSGPAWTFPAAMAGVGVGFTLVIWLAVARTSRRAWGATGRILGAFVPAVSVFLGIGLGWSVAAQRGLDSWTAAPDTGVAFLVAIPAAALVGVGAWFAQPAVEVSAAPAESAHALPLGDAERAVWIGRATGRPVLMWLLALSAALLLVVAVRVAAEGDPSAWIPLVVGFAVLAFAVTTLAFRVRVDARGLAVRGFAGWPSFLVPLADIEDVRVIRVTPLADFGGWGLRGLSSLHGGRFGVVLREGPAIEVARRSGGTFVVTVADAARAAQTLQALRLRAQAADGSA